MGFDNFTWDDNGVYVYIKCLYCSIVYSKILTSQDTFKEKRKRSPYWSLLTYIKRHKNTKRKNLYGYDESNYF